MSDFSSILSDVVAGKRLSTANAIQLLKDADWTEVVQAAHKVRLQKHDSDTVSYTVFRVINYTNVCDIDCSFCSFKDEVHSKHAYVITLDHIRQKAIEAKERGSDQIFLQGGLNAAWPCKYFTEAREMFNHE